MHILERVAARLAHWTGIVVMILVAAFTLLVFASVVLRYGFSQGLDWGEEAGRYLMIWMGFLGASLALRNGGHVGITMIRETLPAPVQRVVTLVASLGILAWFVVTAYGATFLLETVSQKTSLVLPISMFFPYLAVPVGIILMVVQLVPLMIREWRTGGSVKASDVGEGLI
jgi:TRAP-type C4-dicarboxylate transport system permease small subunit